MIKSIFLILSQQNTTSHEQNEWIESIIESDRSKVKPMTTDTKMNVLKRLTHKNNSANKDRFGSTNKSESHSKHTNIDHIILE